jgi:hypothetical protein
VAFSRTLAAGTALIKMFGATNGFHLYKTADTIATVTGSGYFNSITAELRQHDVICVISETGGTPKIDFIFVTSATGAATVTTSATEGVTAT